MEVRSLAQVTSVVGDRRRALGVAFTLAVLAAAVWAQAALADVNGDPIAGRTAYTVDISSAFTQQLRQNGIVMKQTKLALHVGGDVDPTTGAADFIFNKRVIFKRSDSAIAKCDNQVRRKKTRALRHAGSSARGTIRRRAKLDRKTICHARVIYRHIKGGAPGIAKGSEGKIFQLSGPSSVTRNGFGADLSGINVTFLSAAAKHINKVLHLHSLQQGTYGSFSVSYQPQTVVVTGGTMTISVPLTFVSSEPTSNVTGKLPNHCVDPFAGGVTAISPATLKALPDPNTLARLSFPVSGGTVSPKGTDGVVNTTGGIRVASGDLVAMEPASCAGEGPGASTSHTYVDNTKMAPNLGLDNIQANAFIGGTSPGCNTNPPISGCGVIPGDKGPAIGQTIDMGGATVAADPTAKTVVISNALIRNNATSTLVFSGLFPNVSGDPSYDFAAGDKFGIAQISVTTR